MAELDRLGLAVEYTIVEVSADLRARQQARLDPGRVQWLDQLPEAFEGVVLANEVLDAMPVRLFRLDEHGQVLERGVGWQDGFVWQDRPPMRRWPRRSPRACPRCPGMYRKSICRPRPGCARWAAGSGAAPPCCSTMVFPGMSTITRSARAER